MTDGYPSRTAVKELATLILVCYVESGLDGPKQDLQLTWLATTPCLNLSQPVYVLIPQAGRLGIPIVLWRLVDAIIRGGALLDANKAAELFPLGQIAPPPDTPLDDQTNAVLRYDHAFFIYIGHSAVVVLLFSMVSRRTVEVQ